MDFGMKLQNLRKQKGLSQEALAERLNVSRQAVSKWETGEGYPEMDKIILLSDMFEVSLDYLIKDNGDHVELNNADESYFLNSQKIKEYFQFKNQFALGIAGPVAMFILSVIAPIWAADTAYENYGAFIMLTIVAAGVGVIIFVGMSSEKHNELEEKKINISFNDLQELQEEYGHFKSKFGVSIAFGVVLIILAVASMGLFRGQFYDDKVGPTLLFVCVAFSVFLFVFMGIKDSAYKFIVQNKKYIAEKQAEKKSLYSITMPLATIAFLLIGFVYHSWRFAWLVYPIAGILTSVIEGFRKNYCQNE